MMKKIALLITFILAVTVVNAQSGLDYYLQGAVGSKTTLNVYTGSDKKIGQQINEIKGIKTVEDTVFFSLKSTLTGMGTLPITYGVKYYDSVAYVDLQNYLSVANYVKSKVLTLDPMWWVQYPANMQVGDSLPGYVMDRSYGSYSIVTKMVDRVVAGVDTVSTPAGNFECLKITYRIEATAPQGVFVTGYTDWVNKEVGLVKQESTTGSGRVENYFVLQSVEIK